MFPQNNPAYDRCQQESIDFLAARYHAACGDAPGLGKTRTAIRASVKVGARTCLVITLAGVRNNWREHIDENGSVYQTWHVVSFNEAILPHTRLPLLNSYDVVIIDEGHRCKEIESKWTRAIYGRGGLASRGTYIWPLSGTFMPNYRPVELFPMLKTLHPAFARVSFLDYARRFCGGYFDGRAWQANGASNTDELNVLLKDFLIVHTKREAYPGRQAPVIVPVALDLDEERLAAVIEEERRIVSREARISSVHEFYSQLGDAATLRRLTGLAVAPSVVEFVEAKLESTYKIVLFFQHTSVGEYLKEALGDRYWSVFYAGGMTAEQQSRAIEAFSQEEETRLFIAQQQAAGSGINGLQGVNDTIIFAEPDWTPGDTEQRINRLDRMGSAVDLVTAYVLYARGTLGAAIWGVHNRKEDVGRRAGWR